MRMKVVIVIGLPLLLMILGTVGYHQVEGWTWEESFYMTVITISTVGYSELHDMTEAGRMFSVLLILVSFGSLAYCGSLIFGFILEGGIVTFMRKMKMEQQINQLQKHFSFVDLAEKVKPSADTLPSTPCPLWSLKKIMTISKRLGILDTSSFQEMQVRTPFWKKPGSRRLLG